jgi:hypothetical protein
MENVLTYKSLFQLLWTPLKMSSAGEEKKTKSKGKDNNKPAKELADITSGKSTQLYKCVPVDWLWLPKPYRTALGWISLVIFAISFLSVPIAMLLLLPVTWRLVPYFCTGFLALVFGSMVWPTIEWPEFRKVGQLWYEIFDFHCNLSPELRENMLVQSDKHQFAIGMHPHGIVPFHALLWAAYCHQYLSNEKKGLYGFGAVADIVMYLPFLRNIMGWLTGGPADYKTLKLGLTQVRSCLLVNVLLLALSKYAACAL